MKTITNNDQIGKLFDELHFTLTRIPMETTSRFEACFKAGEAMAVMSELKEAVYALAAPPCPWTHMPKGGWTAETLPKQPGTWWAVATCDDDGHVNMFTPSEFGEIDDYSAMAAWRYIDAPTALDGAARDGEE